MRLLFLADASLPHTLRWVNHFATLGHTCLLASVERGDGYRSDVEWLPARESMPRFVRYTRAVPRVRELLRDFAPDVVNSHFLPNYGWLAVRAGARPHVLTALGSDILTVPQRSALHAWRTRYVLQRCDAVTSDAVMLTDAIRGYGFDAGRILTVPLGIEAARFATPSERSETPLVVLSTRRLEPVYDVATLLRAWQRLAVSERGNMELRIVGRGSQEAALRAQAISTPRASSSRDPAASTASESPSSAATFLGWLGMSDLDRELRAAHLYVSTSLSDSTSVSLLEAMAAGCFPVVSDIPANREWIVDGETGLLFACGDDAALADRLRRAGSDAELRQRAAARNRDVIARRATWETNMREVEALFQRLAAKRSA